MNKESKSSSEKWRDFAKRFIRLTKTTTGKYPLYKYLLTWE